MQAKDTNPKDIIGSDKAPLHLVPTTALAETSLSFLEGALKYGQANWRAADVKASIYAAACLRHLSKWYEGQDRDPATGVHHLASANASLMIVMDAAEAGKLIDDRPIACGTEGAFTAFLDKLGERVKHLRAMFANCSPKQHVRAAAEPTPRRNAYPVFLPGEHHQPETD